MTTTTKRKPVVRTQCPTCNGTHFKGAYLCPDCDGEGFHWKREEKMAGGQIATSLIIVWLILGIVAVLWATGGVQ